MATLTAAQLDFLCTHVLMIPNAKEMKSKDPVGLLNLLAERMHKKNPFTNIWDSLTNILLGDKRFKVSHLSLFCVMFSETNQLIILFHSFSFFVGFQDIC